MTRSAAHAPQAAETGDLRTPLRTQEAAVSNNEELWSSESTFSLR